MVIFCRNHDVETGRAVFDRWIATCDFPVLGANIIDTSTGKPHLAPYKVLERWREDCGIGYDYSCHPCMAF